MRIRQGKPFRPWLSFKHTSSQPHMWGRLQVQELQEATTVRTCITGFRRAYEGEGQKM